MVLFKNFYINSKAFMRNSLPLPLILIVEKFRVIPLYFKWKKDKKYGSQNFIKKNKGLKGSFQGKRCVIIGNGPSLNKTDLSLLKNEYTFGLNRIYLLFDRLGFETDFLVSSNRYVIEQFSDEMLQTNCKKFFNYKFKKEIKNKDNVSFITATPFGSKYFDNIEKGYMAYSGSVTFVAIQLALYFGFSEIILIGFDNNFKNSGPSDKAIKSKKSDEDHFDKNYFGKGIVWQLPNYHALNYNFDFVKNFFDQKKHLNIVNCSVGGELHVFERYDLEFYLKNSIFENKICSTNLGKGE